ncbi:protein phosphatase 2C domain-containing protein [Pinibacter aurantiacus]|uniref:Protein phosphatase 2C domain-containing protein n=1 Tax=Pinibacter aurantiacus TaxID=2851599 RepID=A0A9E2SCG5_9BACT|nr:protein phosphatase 2C domain-containing protein [Pinibacter aurantiacus]MBV4360548.1 protein phosphatase 2C domain-containing protein [Pinibacter aurantiacus]
MNRLFFFVLVICCCVQSVYAQTKYELKAISNISKTITSGTTLNQDCKDQVNALQSDLDKAADSLTITTAATNYINALSGQSFKTQCVDARLQQLSNRLNHLLAILKIETHPAKIENQPVKIDSSKLRITKNIVLKISIKDIKSKAAIKAPNVALTDSVNKPVPFVLKNGIVTTTLIPGKRYLLHIAAENYEPIDTAIVLQRNRDVTLWMYDNDVPGADTGTKVTANVIIDTATAQPAMPVPISPKDDRSLITGLYITAASLLALLLGITIAYVLHKKKSERELQYSYNDFKTKEGKYKTEINSKDAIIGELNKNLSVLQSKEETNAAPQTVAATPEPAQKNFVCEAMMTAGPRKKIIDGQTSDIDLGEDVCGWVTHGDTATVWILDGTSDLHFLKNNDSEYFSSRLLAKAIGDKLRKYTIDAQGLSLDQMIDKAIDEVKDDWNKIINALPAEEKELLAKNISENNFPECASTMMIARLSVNGDFEGYRSGDSKMLLYGKNGSEKSEFMDTSLSAKNDDANDRIFFRIMLNEEQLGIVNNKPLYEVVKKSNVRSLILFSDGIGSSTETLLKDIYANEPDKARDDIARQVQGTNDDKTICFVEIR